MLHFLFFCLWFVTDTERRRSGLRSPSMRIAFAVDVDCVRCRCGWRTVPMRTLAFLLGRYSVARFCECVLLDCCSPTDISLTKRCAFRRISLLSGSTSSSNSSCEHMLSISSTAPLVINGWETIRTVLENH